MICIAIEPCCDIMKKDGKILQWVKVMEDVRWMMSGI